MIQTPDFLKKGDLILVVSPSGVVDEEKVLSGAELLKEAGFKVEFAPHSFSKHFKFAGTHPQRLKDLQNALDHATAKGIFCARGGFGLTHIVDDLDWAKFKQAPKWIIGFSDITALLCATYLNGFTSIHASVAQGLSVLSKDNQQAILETLNGNATSLTGDSDFNKLGEVAGEIIGGNLSLLVHQIGTATDIDYKGKILFVEEIAEPLYHADRMLLQLKRAGKLSGLKGLVVGQFTHMSEDKELFGSSVEEVILNHCKEYDFPIGFNFPIGHGAENWPVIHGAKVELKVLGSSAKLDYISASI